MIPNRTIRSAVALVLYAFAASAPLLAQSETVLVNMRELHQKLSKLKLISTDDAKEAREFLGSWSLDAEKLKPEDRVRLLEAEVLAHAAYGDALAALRSAQRLNKETAGMSPLVYVGAAVSGDAALASESLKARSAKATADEKKSLSQRRQWIAAVGKPASDAAIHTDDVQEFNASKPGKKALLIDFWNLLSPPSDQQVSALRSLHAEFCVPGEVAFVGVNTDSGERLPKARQFAKDKAYEWPQRYEDKSMNAPITHQAFKAGTPPWTVLVDVGGQVRAVGSADDSAFAYAVRAVAAETRGDFPRLTNERREGREATAESTSAKPPKPAQPEGELKSDPEAAAKVTQARVFWKTGKKTDAKRLMNEVITDYPNTKEAKEAQEWLDSIGG